MKVLLKVSVENKKLFRSFVGITTLLWAALQVFIVWRHGIVTDGEAPKYILEAQNLLSKGGFSSIRFLLYSVPVILIALSLKMQAGYWFVIAIQILLNGISVVCFYRIVKNISGNKWISIISVFYFLGLYYYHMYNTYLYTESLFFSFSIIYTYLLFSTNHLKIKSLAVIIMALLFVYFTRPTGVFFIPATFLYLLLRFNKGNKTTIIIFGGSIILLTFFLLLNFSMNTGGGFDFLQPYLEGNIICDVPTDRRLDNFIMPVNKNAIEELFYIVTHYSGIFLGLAIRRLISFFGAIRNYYSLFHNSYLFIYFFGLYAVVIINFKSLFKRNKPAVWFLITVIFLMATTVALSCDEWSNRFLLSVTPFILLLAVISVSNRLSATK